MGPKPVRAKLDLDLETRAKLEAVSRSRTEGKARVERAKVLLAYASGGQVTTLAQAFHTNRPKIERILIVLDNRSAHDPRKPRPT